MVDFLKTLQNTPLPTIFVVAGILFLLLGISGGIQNKISVAKSRQNLAITLGLLLIVGGLGIFFVPSPASDRHESRIPDEPSAETTNVSIDEVSAPDIDEFLTWPLIADEAFTAGDGGWYVGSYPDESTEFESRIVSGRYRWEMSTNKRWARHFGSPYAPAVDFFVAADVRFVGIDNGVASAGLVFRKTYSNDYSFRISSNGMFKVVAWETNKCRTLIDWTTVPIDPEATNRIAVLAEGSEIRVFINSELVGRCEDRALTGGNVGLILGANEDTTVTVDFDNFEYRRRP